MNDLDLDPIRKRVQSLPNLECKWKREELTVLDIRDRPVLEVISYLSSGDVADFCVNAPEDIGLLLIEVERLRRERDEALARASRYKRLVASIEAIQAATPEFRFDGES